MKKILQYNLCKVIMNQVTRDPCKKPEEAVKSRVEMRLSIPFVSDCSSGDLDKGMSESIEITYRYKLESA